MEALRAAARRLDAFPKVSDDYVVRSRAGGALTLACAACCLLLFLSEARYHLAATSRTHLTVDSGRDAWAEKLHVEINVSFPEVPCGMLSLEALDVSGEMVLELHASHVRKVSWEERGRATCIALLTLSALAARKLSLMTVVKA